jgi:hypothetical protein
LGVRLAFPEENNASLKKIAKLEDPAEYSKLGLVVRFLLYMKIRGFILRYLTFFLCGSHEEPIWT